MQFVACEMREAWHLYYLVSHDLVNTMNFVARLKVSPELEAKFRTIHAEQLHPFCAAMLNFAAKK